MAARVAATRTRDEGEKRIPTMAERRPVETSTTCIVGCKLPNGLELQLSKLQKQIIAAPGGGHTTVDIGVRYGDKVRINGNRAQMTAGGAMIIPSYLILGGADVGYALTHGVSREFMRAWMQQNHDSDLIANKMIIVADDEASIRALAKENEKIVSGIHPLVPDRKRDVRMRTIGMHPQIRQQTDASVKTVDDVGGDD